MLAATTYTLSHGARAGILIAYAVVVVIGLIAWARILSQSGHSGWWVLIAIVPIVNIIMFFVFAFSKWPVRKQLEALQQGGSQYGSSQYGGGYGPPPTTYGSYSPPGSYGSQPGAPGSPPPYPGS